MERLYENNTETNTYTYYSIIENNLEYLCEKNEFGDIKSILNDMSPKEYSEFLHDVWLDFMHDTKVWKIVTDSITESVRKRIPKEQDVDEQQKIDKAVKEINDLFYKSLGDYHFRCGLESALEIFKKNGVIKENESGEKE